MHHRQATHADIPILARMNQHLREDEQSRWSLTLSQLEDRMRQRFDEGYAAIIFELDVAAVAYALYRETEGGVHLREFFVSRDHRRQGIGKQAIAILLHEVWPASVRITLDVLVTNPSGQAFWQALGFSEYAITLELTRT